MIRSTFFVALLLLVAAPQAKATVIVPSGLNPGDTYHLIYVTSTIHNVTSSASVPPPFPAFGSRGGADWIVTLGAFNAGYLPDWDGASLEWNAALSITASSLRSHVNISGPVYNTAGQLVATGDADLFDGTIDHAVQYDEFGNLVTSNLNVWTGSATNGSQSVDDCGDWNDPSSGTGGEIGSLSVTNGTWISNADQACDQTAHLYGVSPLLTVPEPSSTCLILAGLILCIGTAAWRRRMRKA